MAAATAVFICNLVGFTVLSTSITADFDLTETERAWVISAYPLAVSVSLLPAGAIGDRFGHRAVITAGLALVGLFGLLGTIAPSGLALIAARGLAGVGGGLTFSPLVAILGEAYEDEERARAIRLYGLTVGFAAALGPLACGALETLIGWRGTLAALGVAAAACSLLVAARVPTGRPEEPGARSWKGATAFAAAVSLLVFACIESSQIGISSPIVLGCLVASLLAAISVWLFERGRARALVPIDLFARRSFLAGLVAVAAVSAGFAAAVNFVPIFLDEGIGLDLILATALVSPFPLAMCLAAPALARLRGSYSRGALATAGLALACASLGGLAAMLAAGSSEWLLTVPLALAGFGIGIVNPISAALAIRGVANDRFGVASGVNATFRQVSFAVSTATYSALLAAAGSAEAGIVAILVSAALLVGAGSVALRGLTR